MPEAQAVARKLQPLLGRALAALPARAQLALSGGQPVQLDGQQLDPGIQLLLRLLALSGEGGLAADPDADPLAERERAHAEALANAGRPTVVGDTAELEVDGGAGPLPARHYAPPDPSGREPLLVFFHGGGWVICDLDTHDEACRLICRHAGVHVLSVAYRLAPEHRFPAAVEDALAATRWALANAAQLGADSERVGVAGDSAGGNLAAVVARLLAREGAGRLALQVLIYPATDFAGRRRSDELFAEGFFLTQTAREWFERHYLPDGVDRADPRLSPLRARDLDGLAPAVVATAAFDPLRDQGEEYALALRRAGNRVALRRFPGLIHGFINFTGVNRASREATIALAGMIRGALPAG